MDETQLPVARMRVANEQLIDAIRQGLGLKPVPWQHQRPGLVESVVFIAACIACGGTAGLVVSRLAAWIGG